MEPSIAKHVSENQHANQISVRVYGEQGNCGTYPACVFHEGSGESHIFTKRINVPARLLGVDALSQFVPVYVQYECVATV